MSTPRELPRINRRIALKWIATATASIPALGGVTFGANNPPAKLSPDARGYGPDPDILKIYKPGDLWPLTFSNDQRKLVIVLCDLIIPADALSPSASSQGVHDFIDEWISSPYPDQAPDRKLILQGLAWLDEEAQRQGAKTFVSLKPKEQSTVCRELAKAAKEDKRHFPGSFFLRMRDLVSGGYYTTPVGMRDIGYLGNVPMPAWNGPPPEVLKQLGLSPQT